MINLVTNPAMKRKEWTCRQTDFVDYRLVALLEDDLRLAISQEREEFRKSFGIEPSHELPGLCFASFQAKEMMESVIARWLQRICGNHACQALDLNNYSSFPQNSIYLRVQDPAAMNQLAQQLKIIDEYIRSNDCPPIRIHCRPGVTIAENLTPEVYEKAAGLYSGKAFHARLEIKQLFLLKKIDPADVFRKANVFHLMPTGSPK